MGENRLMCDLYEENQRLKERIKELEEKHFSECGQIAAYDDELKALLSKVDIGAAKPKDYLDLLNEWTKMKELLKEANKDIFDMLTERFGTLCEFCKWYNKSDAECASPRNGSGSWCCEYGGWRREGEALALIGEDVEQNDT